MVRALAVALGLVLGVPPAQAQGSAATVPPAAPWALGFAAAGGGMLTDDQRGMLGLGGGGGLARVEIRARPFDGVDWIETEVRGSFSVIGPGLGGAVGGLLALALGVRVAPRVDDVRPYAAVAFGLGLTGPLARPSFEADVGVALPLSDELSLAPEVGLVHVVQWDEPGLTSDAIFLSGGLALAYRPVERPPEPPSETEVVVVAEERVVTTPPPEIAFERAPPPPPTDFEELSFLVDAAVCGAGVEIVTLLPPVLFEFDHAELTAAGEVAMHDVLARIEAAPAGARIVIEGHADATGTDDYNDALALARARTVGAWLVAHGVDAARVREAGHGEHAPLVGGATPEELAPNRRVTIRLEHDGAVRP